MAWSGPEFARDASMTFVLELLVWPGIFLEFWRPKEIAWAFSATIQHFGATNGILDSPGKSGVVTFNLVHHDLVHLGLNFMLAIAGRVVEDLFTCPRYSLISGSWGLCHGIFPCVQHLFWRPSPTHLWGSFRFLCGLMGMAMVGGCIAWEPGAESTYGMPWPNGRHTWCSLAFWFVCEQRCPWWRVCCWVRSRGSPSPTASVGNPPFEPCHCLVIRTHYRRGAHPSNL